MSKIIKKILLSLALLLSFAFISCAQEESAEIDAEQIVANVLTANAEADTCKFDMDMLIAMEVVGESQPTDMTMGADITGMVSNISKEMQMTVDMTVDIAEQAEQEMAMDMDMSMELYITGEWMYMKLDMPIVGEQWMKMGLTEEMWKEQSLIEQQLQFLTAPIEINLLGSEEVEGTACYVIEITPTIEALSNWLSQQQTLGMEDIDLEEFDLAYLFKELSYKCWIAKDSYLLMKAKIYMLMEIIPEDVEATEEEFEKMTMDMNMEMKLYDYNQPVSIELPQEALEAPEMPGGN